MQYRYPVKLTRLDNGSMTAEFPDVPEALTHGVDEDNALYWARDALLVALSGYMDDRRSIPAPSEPKRSARVLEVPPMQSVKLAIYQAMLENHVTQAVLGERMRIDGRQVRRILDLDHNTRLDHLLRALEVLGKRVSVAIDNAA